MSDTPVKFDFPQDSLKIIKVIGVGGGGGNAVDHMFNEGIHDVSFVLCNTDKQALNNSKVPNKLQLGKEGLGAGNVPQRAKEAAEESSEDIKKMLNDGTKMVFITATMGGGTGTGAAPVIAKVAKEMGLLTIGIVTIPFGWEGEPKIDQALDGVEEMSKNVDAMLVINNQKLLDIYGELSVKAAFAKANDTLTVAAKCIAEIITIRGEINLDFNDVKTVLKDGGVAIMSVGYAEGEGRVGKALQAAQSSPLLNNNDIFNSKKVLLNVASSTKNDLQIKEMNEIKAFMAKFESRYEIKWGLSYEESLGSKVKVTLLATGFGMKDIDNDKLKQRIAIKDAQSEAEMAKKKKRRDTYYSGSNISEIHTELHLYTFKPEDFDNDDVISAVENTPVYKRDITAYKAIENKTTHSATTDNESTEEESSAIVF